MAASSIRFGPGCTREVGKDLRHLKARRVMLVTDKIVKELDGVKRAMQGLEEEDIPFSVYDDVTVEPKDSSYVPCYMLISRRASTEA